jgi:mono/diheme cytochrome c family protein
MTASPIHLSAHSRESGNPGVRADASQLSAPAEQRSPTHLGPRLRGGERKKGLTGTIAAIALLAAPLPALAQDAARLAAGKAIWSDAGCAGCHGTNAQGGTSPDLPPGPGLRATKLDRQGLVDVISCGKPGTPMPAWVKGAYVTRPCPGQGTAGQVPDATVVVGAYSAAEIDTLVDYILATFVGK